MRRRSTIVAMRRLPQALVFLGLAACATASGTGDDIVADDAPEIDADPNSPDARPPIDAADPIDSGPQMVTLSQSTAQTITALNTLACGNANSTLENHYYRVFKLSDFGINTAFTAEHVDFAVEDADTVAGSQTVQVRLHTLSGATPTVANMTLLYGQNVMVPDTATNTIVGVDLTSTVVVPAGSTLVLELFSAGSTQTGDYFYAGSNAAGESGPSYIRAPPAGCDLPEITPYSTIDGTGMVHLVMSVTGTKP
jgi:hypothetical protein